MAGMEAQVDAFPYRPVGEHPPFARIQAYREVDAAWDQANVRLLCLPVDFIAATVHKQRVTKSPAILLIPDWPRQAWHAAALQNAQRVEVSPRTV